MKWWKMLLLVLGIIVGIELGGLRVNNIPLGFLGLLIGMPCGLILGRYIANRI